MIPQETHLHIVIFKTFQCNVIEPTHFYRLSTNLDSQKLCKSLNLQTINICNFITETALTDMDTYLWGCGVLVITTAFHSTQSELWLHKGLNPIWDMFEICDDKTP